MEKNWLDDFPEATPLDHALASEKVSQQVADLARSIYAQESSSGKNTRTSNAGAVGGMQVRPATFKDVADEGWDINDPVHNARAGVRYVAQMHELAGGDPKLTAVGYYGGPGGIEKAKQGIAVADPRNPNAPNTLEYAAQVVDRSKKTTPTAAAPAASAQPASADWLSAFPEVDSSKKAETKAATSPPTAASAAAKAPTAPAARRSMLEELGRQVGLTIRAGAKGVASLPGLVVDAATGTVNDALNLYDKVRTPTTSELVTGKQRTGPRFVHTTESVDRALDAIGLPRPENKTERVVQDAASAMASAGSFAKAGEVLSKAASPVVAEVGKQLASGVGLQVASGAAGAAASGAVRESGGGVGAQVAAGLAAGLAPGFAAPAAKAAVRGVVRGGEAGRKQMADTVKTFEQAGTTPTVAQATGGRFARATESLLAKTPGGAGVIAKKAQQQADEMQAAVQRLSDELAPGANAVNAGEAISRGIKAFKDGFKTVQSHLYDNLDQHIPAGTPIGVGNTEFALKQLTADIPGAPNLSKWFVNSKVKGIDKALQADLELAQTTGTLPYEAIKRLRTLVGNEIADNSLVSDVPRSKWNSLYGALSEDLGEAAKKAGPQAEQAWSWANQFTRDQLKRLDELSGIVARDAPERVFTAAIAGTAEGDTVIRRIVNALPKAERREVAAAVLQRLGRATPGQQNAMGDAFSSETFLTNLAKLSAAARKTIFGRTDAKGIEEQLANLGKIAEMRREGGRVFANPSGTASSAAQIAVGGGVGGAAASSIATGNPLPLSLAVTVPAAANILARGATNPKVVQFLADKTELLPGAAASAIEAASRVHGTDPAHAWLKDFPEHSGEQPPAQPMPTASPEAAASTPMATAPAPVIPETDPQPEPEEEAPAQETSLAPAQPALGAQEALAARITVLRDAGEKHLAEALQRRMIRQQANEELSAMTAAAAPGTLHAAPEFGESYRLLRARGEPPGEAAARSSMTVGFRQLAAQHGMSEKATAAALKAAEKLAPAAVPQFAQRFAAALAARGALPPEAADSLHDGLARALSDTEDLVLAHHYPEPAQRAPVQSEPGEAAADQPYAESAPSYAENAQPESLSAPEDAQNPDAVSQTASIVSPDEDVVSASEQPEESATAQAAPDFTHELRNDGTVLLKGDPSAIRETLLAAGVPASALLRARNGVHIGRSAAPVVVAAIDRVHAAADLDAKAHEAATSPTNDLPEPTQQQADAGNYRKGHVRLQGLDITIENPRGSTRRGVAPDGTPWESTLASHYGYVRRSKGNDGDHVDVFIGPDPHSEKVFVVDQIDPETGRFDEHKSLLGFDSIDAAREGYLANYDEGWQGLGAITELPIAAFKSWVHDGVKRKPLGDIRGGAA